MTWLKKNWWILAITVVIVIALYLILKPNPDRLLIKEMERQRDEAMADYREAQKIIERLQQDTAKMNKNFRAYLKKDSLQDIQEAINYEKLKKAYYKIQYNNLTDPEIDSVINSIIKRSGYRPK